MSQSKLPCTVAGRYQGLAHLVEAPCDGHTFWYGSLDLAIPQPQAAALAGADLPLRLEDGRAGRCRCVASRCREVLFSADRGDEGEHVLLYVVGLSRLEPPGGP
jgi:hypothetical protein